MPCLNLTPTRSSRTVIRFLSFVLLNVQMVLKKKKVFSPFPYEYQTYQGHHAQNQYIGINFINYWLNHWKLIFSCFERYHQYQNLSKEEYVGYGITTIKLQTIFPLHCAAQINSNQIQQHSLKYCSLIYEVAGLLLTQPRQQKDGTILYMLPWYLLSGVIVPRISRAWQYFLPWECWRLPPKHCR